MSSLQHPNSSLRKIIEEEEKEENITIFICENTDGVLDPLDQMTFALNETALTYGPVVVLKDAP